MAIAGFTSTEETYFQISPYDISSRTYSPTARLVITYAMSLDVNLVSRSVVTFFDVLGNVGGLSGVLFAIAGAIHGILTF